MSILAGIGNLVDDWLRIHPTGNPPYYRHRTAANELTRRNAPIDGTREFLDASYTRINTNWMDAIDAGYTNPSKENWRWKQHLELSAENSSPELNLERAIVSTCGDNWSNQMPTASGLVGPATDKRAAVDLVHRENETTYSLIELKVASDTPLFAAIEILMYGLLFVWSRSNQEALGYDLERQSVLAASNVTLEVLAPPSYFQGFDLSSLVTGLNDGLAEFGERNGLSLGFKFCQFGKDLGPGLSLDDIRSSIDDRCAVWRSE